MLRKRALETCKMRGRRVRAGAKKRGRDVHLGDLESGFRVQGSGFSQG